MARGKTTLPFRFFKIILQTNLQRIKIPNEFTRRHGVGLSNPVLIKPPDGTKWKVYWKKFNGEIWFEKGWKTFTENYSLGHGFLVLFKYEEGTSKFLVHILGKNAVEIDYDENVDHSDDESCQILDEWPNQKTGWRRPLDSPRPRKKVRGEIKKTTERTTSLNWPMGARAREVAAKFISNNPFFTIFIKPNHLVETRLCVPNLEGVIENKEKYVVLQIRKRSWTVKLLRYYEAKNGRHLSAGWSLFASESGLQSGDVCVFELINKQDLVFKIHVL